jgi:hypothetical protein
MMEDDGAGAIPTILDAFLAWEERQELRRERIGGTAQLNQHRRSPRAWERPAGSLRRASFPFHASARRVPPRQRRPSSAAPAPAWWPAAG